MDVPIQINEICSSGIGLWSYRTARGIKVADDSPPEPKEANRGMQMRKLNQELSVLFYMYLECTRNSDFSE